MKEKNICKFITEMPPETLKMQNFVFESNPNVTALPLRLEHHRLILMKEGNVTYKLDGKDFLVHAGSVIFGFHGETLEVLPNGKCEYMYISFSGSRAETLFSRLGIDKNNRCFSGFDGVIPLWHDSLIRANDINIDLASESVLLYTLSRFTKVASKTNDLINQIIKITEEQFTNPELSITEISNMLSYNAKYLSHAFRDKMGITYSEHLRNLRIKYAVSLLDHGIDSVKNIAYLSGFSDPLYFSSVFKKVVGVSPKEYKES